MRRLQPQAEDTAPRLLPPHAAEEVQQGVPADKRRGGRPVPALRQLLAEPRADEEHVPGDDRPAWQHLSLRAHVLHDGREERHCRKCARFTPQITQKGFLDYNDILMHGTDEEKQEQNFRMMDLEGVGHISFAVFKKFVIKAMDMYSVALLNRSKGSHSPRSQGRRPAHRLRLQQNFEGQRFFRPRRLPRSDQDRAAAAALVRKAQGSSRKANRPQRTRRTAT